MITRSLSRWRSRSSAWLGSISIKQRLNDLRTQLGGWISVLLLAPMKPKHKLPMQQRTMRMSHVEQLRT